MTFRLLLFRLLPCLAAHADVVCRLQEEEEEQLEQEAPVKEETEDEELVNN